MRPAGLIDDGELAFFHNTGENPSQQHCRTFGAVLGRNVNSDGNFKAKVVQSCKNPENDCENYFNSNCVATSPLLAQLVKLTRSGECREASCSPQDRFGLRCRRPHPSPCGGTG